MNRDGGAKRVVQITPGQVTGRFRGLFDAAAPAGLRCFGVMDDLLAGRMWADDPVAPTWGVVQEAASGTIYPGGKLDAATLSHLIADLRREGDVLLGLWDDDPLLAALPANADYDGRVLEFWDRDGEGDGAILARLPDGCEVRLVDRALLGRCLWGEETIQSFGSVERFEANGLGFCLVRSEEILCEAFAGRSGLGHMELGAITHEAHRRRGYATLLCAHLARACEQRGFPTYWNCAKQNVASAAVARKLGFQPPKEYRLLAWFKPST